MIYAEPGDFNFEGVGGSIAIWDDPDGLPVRPNLGRYADHPDLLWGPDDGEWSNAPAIADDHLYGFSCPQRGWDRPCFLGRVPLERVQDYDAWRYWTGTSWSRDPDDAGALFDGAPIMSLSFNSYLDSWLLVYSPPLDDGIYARTAPELTGPWSSRTKIYTVDGEHTPYDAVHHAELSEGDGRVAYVTWSRSSGEGWFGTEFALLRVEFE